ncbi:PucR family transcriptional regulator [Actinomadura sp. HBU206391]|uniref:PucR family transcriptional regulator n=1 Tax=Actinomadura sp. HBU206391 TaxID=2731692 RepID=UPI00164F0CF6|nr:helix-turn-helix domain-containing protein [Actinomadura sp. HBU206391]MBC6461856.1 helix-turn-helix domain-containing protein [Actinomadura sp. HBU206391]
MLLRDLLDISELRLVLRTGERALERPVRWVYTTELVLPGRYLIGDEFVLTGLMWRKGHEDPDWLVATLVEAGASALGVGTAVHGLVPPGIVVACRRRGLPLIEVPAEVSFGTVNEVVTRRLMAERTAGLTTAMGRHRRMISSMADGAGLDAVFAGTREDLGRGCWIVTPTGRVVAGPETGLTSDDARRLAAGFLTADRLPHVVRTGRAYTLLPVGTRARHRAAAWFLACEGELGHADEEVTESAYELAALAALERARIEEGRRVERRMVAELAELPGPADSAGSAQRSSEPARLVDPGEVAARMRACGLSPVEPYVAVSASVGEVAHPDECVVLEELLSGARAVIGGLGGEAIALVPAAGISEVVAGMRATSRFLEPSMAGGRLTIGVSGPADGPAALRGAVEEARHTRRMAGGRPDLPHVVTSDEVQSHALLLANVPAAVRTSFRDRLLRPLRDYDAEHHSDLMSTLEAFLDCSGSWSRCAARLHIHVNTLRYRIRRIEELTGRDLSTLENRVDLFLALRAR